MTHPAVTARDAGIAAFAMLFALPSTQRLGARVKPE
jgi:hypothetical protein